MMCIQPVCCLGLYGAHPAQIYLSLLKDPGVRHAKADAGANVAFSPTAEWLVAQRLPIVFVRPPIVAAKMELDQPNPKAAAAADALADAPPDAKLAVV